VSEPTTTADILAAWQLIEEHGLTIVPEMGQGGWACHSASWVASGCNRIAAVRAWAKAAGVPWPAVKVVPMWAVVGERGIIRIYAGDYFAKVDVVRNGGHVVPCDVVIREIEGV